MNKEQIVYIKVKDLKLNEKNPRKNDEAVPTVMKSIQELGFRNPLIIDSTGKVWCGNTRLKASRKLGLEEVPCIVVDDLTEKEIRKLALLDNKSSEISEWDYDLLSEELAELDFGDFELDWGILDYPDKEELEENGGTIEENNPEVAVSIVFKNTMEWRKYEDKLREFFKEIDDVKIKVGEYNEIEHSNTDSI